MDQERLSLTTHSGLLVCGWRRCLGRPLATQPLCDAHCLGLHFNCQQTSRTRLHDAPVARHPAQATAPLYIMRGGQTRLVGVHAGGCDALNTPLAYAGTHDVAYSAPHLHPTTTWRTGRTGRAVGRGLLSRASWRFGQSPLLKHLAVVPLTDSILPQTPLTHAFAYNKARHPPPRTTTNPPPHAPLAALLARFALHTP